MPEHTKAEPEAMHRGEGDDVFHKPSFEEQKVLEKVLHSFRESADNRDRNFKFFDGRNLVEFINDSTERYYTNVDEREGLEDWQARVHDKFTHNKVKAFLSKLVKVLPIAELSSVGDEDIRKGNILSTLYEFAEEQDDYDEFMIYFLLEAIVKGTAIGYEGLNKSERKVRDITGYDEDGNPEIKENTIKENELFGAIVALEEFYPQSMGMRNIKSMDYCFWSKTMPASEFYSKWGHFKKAEKVSPYSHDWYGERKPEYLDYLEGNVDEGNVRVIRYYNKQTDEYIIVANDVWLNPLSGDKIAPLPWAHKELPFWDVKFDLFDSQFFYGDSLPNRLKNMQDVLNVLTNMLLDQSFLTIFPPILTNGNDGIEDDYLYPGRRTSVDTQGLPLDDSFMKLDLGTPQGWHQYILEYTRNVMEESSVGQVSQGVAGVGDRTTAQEIRTAAEAVEAMLGLFGKMVNYGIKRKAFLKASNILQFWTDEKSPRIEKIMGEGGAKEMKDVFNTFKVDNTTLSSGKRGTRIIELYRSNTEMPRKSELQARSKIASKDTKRDIEIIAISPEYIRDFQYDVKIVPSQKREATKDMNKALQLEKTRVYSTFFPDLVDRTELASQLAESFGDDPTKIFNDQTVQQALGQAQPQVPGMDGDQTASLTPQGDVSNNAVRGMMGGEQASNDLRELQNSLTG